MKKINVAIMGIGTVGGGTYEILTKNRDFLRKTQGVDFEVTKVLDKNLERIRSFGIPDGKAASSVDEIAADKDISIVVETMGGVEPAKTFIEKVLHAGKSVVTANKELVSKHWPSLEAAAKKGGAGLYFEASCVGGVPIIRALQEGLQANKVDSLVGIINGTTNYILSKMTDEGVSYADALKEAQQLGYAEFNPTADVEGFDAAYKLSILSSLAFHTKVPLDKVYREGITGISKLDIAYGEELGYVLKLLAIGKNDGAGRIEVRVHPAFIRKDHPLASVNDSFNAVFLQGDSVGEIMLYGRGAGSLPTGSAIVSDVIYAATHADHKYATFKNTQLAEKGVRFVTDFQSRYYIRFTAHDRAGVLAKVAGVFAKYNISIVDFIQKGEDFDRAEGEGEGIPVILITHTTSEFSVRRAVEKIAALDGIVQVNSVIRVEN